jgi:hypothetical protein
MPLTQVETVLRRVARDRIEKGQLPHVVPPRMWGGKGAGRRCSLCDKPIGPDEMELEVEQHSAGKAEAALSFHVACHALWQLECAQDPSLVRTPRVTW